GAIVALPYGVEGFCPTKQMAKQDGTPMKVGEKLEFRVIEFNKDSKRIVVSHLRTYEEPRANDAERKPRHSKKEEQPAQQQLEKTTLGDLSALSALKAEMDAATLENMAKKANEEKAE
ncbi:MAG: S1 RNA-binding domain-containing protein, partial [Paludibacteraceae bacterium]|nr:S1 RNA-binding domain-containing protein [Paludibacteraceae bacterium]